MPVAVNEYSPQKGGAEVVPGGMETWGGRRSAGCGLLCGSFLPFSRRRGAGVDRVDFVRILQKSTLVLVTEVSRLVLPIRSHPINPIRSSPAGGGVRVFPGTAGTCRATVRDPGALRGRLGAGVVAYVPLIRALVTLSRAPRETALFQVHCCHSSLPRAVCVGRIYSGLWRNYG